MQSRARERSGRALFLATTAEAESVVALKIARLMA